jgi:CheY-like chemotaxis protein
MTEIDGQRFATIFSTDNTSAMENERKQKKMVEQALVKAEAASKAKTNFLNNVSHDIRTPMNAIIGFTKLATTHIDNQDKVKDYLSKIMASGNHLLSLINDILDMSRIESGKIHLNETECNLSEQMHDIRSIIQADIKEKNMDFYIDAVDVFDEDVFCDKLRLNQILLNLLGNALKFTNPGGRIDVRITEKPIDSKEIANYEFRVKDSGIGMSREFVKRIFEPFEREQTSTISKVQGTGLGMSITKNLVDMMGGTIQVFSEKGKGSEFIVTIPLKKVEKKKDTILVEELRGVRALVVDDDFHMCKSVTNTLIQFGMRAEWTMNGREAISLSKQAISQKDEYQAYIIDWIMPDINGVDVVRQIRKEVGEHIPIIILTAYDWVEIEQEAMEAGVTAFCQRPLFISDLRKCLMKVMNLVQMNSEEIKEEEKHFHGEKILLVEDNILNQEIAVEILENHGFLVEVAKNGAQAVDMVSQSKAGDIDTILMDIQMPVMDGYEATKAIRSLSNQALANIPIIAMTANVFEEDRKKARDVGMDGYLAKPIDIPVLLETLQASGALENHTIF